MQNFLGLVFGTFMLWMAGCASDAAMVKDENMSTTTRMAEAVEYQILKTGQIPQDRKYYNEKARLVEIFRSDRPDEVVAFKHLYKALTGEDAPAFKGTVIVATAGLKTTGGYALELKKVTQNEGSVEVVLKLNEPPQGALVTEALTNPYIVILLPDSYKPVKIIES